MCELLGMSANVPTDICFSFTGLVQRGGGTGPHKDGWGITFYEGKGCRTFKDPQPSFQSPIAKLVQDYPIKSCSVVAHIRQANRGRVALENTHPFTRELWGRNWTYAHNGAPFGVAKLLDQDVEIDFQRETTPNDVVTVIATQPLTANETWHKIMPGEWALFCLGERVV